MPRLLALPLAALLAACGGGSAGNPGGGTGGTDAPGGPTPIPGGDATPLAVTSTSTPLSPASVVGAVATNAACTRNGAGAAHSAIRIVATSWAATCGGLRDNKANSTTLEILVSRTRTDGQAPAPIGPAQYRIGATGDASAEIRVARKDARCGPGDDPAANQATGREGAVTVTSVSPKLEGWVDATLHNDARVTGTFSVAPCAISPGDACDVATLDPTSPGVCVQ